MRMPKLNKSLYDVDGVEFTIYETIKFTKSRPKKYWLLQDYSTGRRRLLNNRTLRAAEQMARKIRAAMERGRVDRLSLSNFGRNPSALQRTPGVWRFRHRVQRGQSDTLCRGLVFEKFLGSRTVRGPKIARSVQFKGLKRISLFLKECVRLH